MKLTALLVGGFLLISGACVFLLMKSLRDDVEKQYSQAAEEPLVDFAHLFASLVEQDIADGKLEVGKFREAFSAAYRREFLARIYQLEKTSLQTHVYIADEDGIIVFDSEGGRRVGEDYSRYNDVFLAQQGQYGRRASRIDPDDPRSTVFFVAAPIRDRDRLVGTLTVARPETAMAPFVEERRAIVLQQSVLAGCAVIALATIWTWFLLRPIQGLTESARKISRGGGSAVPTVGLGEWKTLSTALEDMRRELDGKHYVENYVQALTHELKSPLAAIRGAAELIDESMPEATRKRFLKNILAETERSEELVSRLVQLAAIENQVAIGNPETIDLHELIEQEAADLKGAFATKSLTWQISVEGAGFRLKGDRLMLRIAIRNAIQNAIDFSPNAGTLVASLISSERGSTFELRDEGPGLPDYAINRVFDRFYSLKHEATGRKGSGLGLSFIQQAVALHHGSVSLNNAEDGGAVIRMQFGETESA
ncbi:MAG: two-component system sensor histidine kinase CreC [Verrucomicrobiota bacterium]